MKILVTGGSGLVGNAIKNLVNGHNVYNKYEWIFLNSRECDLRDKKMTENYIFLLKPDIIINLAACVGGLYKNINNRKTIG